MYSLLQKLRMNENPRIPDSLQNFASLDYEIIEKAHQADRLASLFPHSKNRPFIRFKNGIKRKHSTLKIGVVLSGGQAPGGHNVIAGLYDAMKLLNPNSTLYGFLGGPSGILENRVMEITEERLSPYRNQGGFDLIGSGRTKIETEAQFKAAESTIRLLQLDGLVIIGGDDSNTNAALLAEYCLQNGMSTRVIGVPKTVDGDLKNEQIEISFGFDSATKTYSEIIGNIARDALSAKKYYYFIKLMGRSASHITLECALQTHPNLALISEEIKANKHSLKEITNLIADLICDRAKIGKDYGVILIPEGLIEFIPEFKKLIDEINRLPQTNDLSSLLSNTSQQCFDAIPAEIQTQLLLDRDPHGNIQVSKIETERLLIETVKRELKARQKAGTYKGKFNAQPHFCGYEGRSCFPSRFDSEYCYSLGYTAALLVDANLTGYMCTIQGLLQPLEDWQAGGVSLVSMMHLEERNGVEKPVIRKALVDITKKPFLEFTKEREKWRLEDDYHYPGPIQFYGPAELVEAVTLTLEYESTEKSAFAQAGME